MKLPKYWLMTGLASLALVGGCGEMGSSTGSFSNVPAPPAPPSGSLTRATSDLFLPSSGSEAAQKGESGTYSRSRVVTIDPTALPGDAGGTVKITLFNGVSVTVEFGASQTMAGAKVWTGHVVGEPTSSIVLVQNEGIITATVSCSLGTFDLKWLGNNRVEVGQKDSRTAPRCSHERPRNPRGSAPPPVRGKGDAEAQASSIDVYVVYNAGAKANLGGTAAGVNAKAVSLVAAANSAMSNSQAGEITLNFIGSEEVNYTQASNTSVQNADLDALATGAAFASVRAKRNTLGADLICLLLDLQPVAGQGFTAGIAFTPDKSTGLIPEAGYSVVALDGDNLTFAHEIGHNFGCQHDVGQNPIPPAEALYPFAYGFRVAGVFGTVMAYPQGNEFAIPNFTIPNFSNPGVMVQNRATGQTGTAENFKTLIQSGPGVAAYTAHVTPSPTPTPVPTPTPQPSATPAPSPQTGTVTVNLNAGWNGVGFERQQVTTLNTTSAIAGMATFDGSAYQTTNFNPTEINAGDGTRRGFFVFATGATSFNYAGAQDTKGNFVNLKSGYNLVTFVTSTNVAGSSLKAFQGSTEVPIGSVVLPQFFEIQPNNTYATVDVTAGGSVKPGKAYFVFSLGTVQLRF